MDQPLITIITVTYNAENVLEETIQSVLSQNYSNIEYIIIDGGSTDGTLKIIKHYEKEINKWITQDDHGTYDAMNKGVKLSSGKYVNFMNAGDTFVNQSVISTFIKQIESDYDLYYGGANMHITNNEYYKAGNTDFYNTVPICHQAIFTKRNLLINNPFDLKYKIASDYDFLFKLYNEGIKFKNLDIPICNFDGSGVSTENKLFTNIEALHVLSNYASVDEVLKSHLYISMLQSFNTRHFDDSIVEEIKIKLKQSIRSLELCAENVKSLKSRKVVKFTDFIIKLFHKFILRSN